MYFRTLYILAIANFLFFLKDFLKKNEGKKHTEISKSSWVLLGLAAAYSLMICSIRSAPAGYFRIIHILATANFVYFLIDYAKKSKGKKRSEINGLSRLLLGAEAVYMLMVWFVCSVPTAFFRTL